MLILFFLGRVLKVEEVEDDYFEEEEKDWNEV
jgi:hypothetical protein